MATKKYLTSNKIKIPICQVIFEFLNLEELILFHRKIKNQKIIKALSNVREKWKFKLKLENLKK